MAQNFLANNIDGLILTNSTIKRRQFNFYKQSKKRGLSGKPCTKTNIILKKMYDLTNGQIPLIGVGVYQVEGIVTKKIKSGASLVQLYTAFILAQI